jgi:hypothetical protein
MHMCVCVKYIKWSFIQPQGRMTLLIWRKMYAVGFHHIKWRKPGSEWKWLHVFFSYVEDRSKR